MEIWAGKIPGKLTLGIRRKEVYMAMSLGQHGHTVDQQKPLSELTPTSGAEEQGLVTLLDSSHSAIKGMLHFVSISA